MINNINIYNNYQMIIYYKYDIYYIFLFLIKRYVINIIKFNLKFINIIKFIKKNIINI